MPFELLPFICGALLSRWLRTTRQTAISCIIIGTVCAALAGELSWPAPQALLAVATDSLIAAAAALAARLTIRVASGRVTRG